jgi:hypothetical protein
MNKKLVFFVVLLVLGLARVFPVVSSVNNLAGSNATAAPALVADGDPRPAPIPHRGVLIADGSPSPAPVPHRGLLVADGSPSPAPVPSLLVADGSPSPAPVPHRGLLVADGFASAAA